MEMELQLTERQEKLLEFVKEQHGEQKRKYTGEPYWTHPVEVATLLQKYLGDEFYYKEIALCHDLLEDTKCSGLNLIDRLLFIGYNHTEAEIITSGVLDLTDRFTKEDYPSWNRSNRKSAEADRLFRICSRAKTIKCADLIHNTSSIVEHDPNFAKIYLKEKEQMVGSLQGAHIGIYIDVCYSLRRAQLQLESIEIT